MRPTRVKCTAPNHRNRRFELRDTSSPLGARGREMVWPESIRWGAGSAGSTVAGAIGRTCCVGLSAAVCRVFVGVLSQGDRTSEQFNVLLGTGLEEGVDAGVDWGLRRRG